MVATPLFLKLINFSDRRPNRDPGYDICNLGMINK